MAGQAGPIITFSAGNLIQRAKTNPPEPMIEGLLNVGDVMLLHGWEESFKSVIVLQLAENLAAGTPFLRTFNVPVPRTVGVVETEIHEVMLGERLAGMFPDGSAPENLKFLSSSGMKDFRKAKDVKGKLDYIAQWVKQEAIEVLLIDTVNDFFREAANPSDEATVGGLFDHLRNMVIKARVLVRHDRKKKGEDQYESNSNELIRGSGEWKEDPEVILYVCRQDRRTHAVYFEVGKLRYGRKPEPMTLWFDAQTFRMTPLPPVIAVLESGPATRKELLDAANERFSLGERKTDEMLSEEKRFLRESQQGHQKVFWIDPERVADAPWGGLLRSPEEGDSSDVAA
jgi:hypothetical protein